MADVIQFPGIQTERSLSEAEIDAQLAVILSEFLHDVGPERFYHIYSAVMANPRLGGIA